MFQLSARALRELAGVHPALVAVVQLAWTYLNSEYEVIDGIRSLAEQRNYVRRGVSKTLNSYHLPWKGNGLGHATDIVPMVNGVPKWPNDYDAWKDIEQAMKRAARELGVPLQWGGDWKNRWDKPHWQIPRGFVWKHRDAPVEPKPAPLPRNVGRTDRFRKVLPLILKHEGGYVNHPSDPGGATNRGITIHTLKLWRKRPVTANDVKNLTMAETEQIYEAFYWDALRCDDLPPGVDYAVFDIGVNSGIGRAAKFLQKLVRVEQDGRIGKDTMRRLEAYLTRHGRHKFINAYADMRLAYLKRLKTWPTFGKGWARRVKEMREVALVMAGREKVANFDRDLVPDPKAPGTDAAPAKRVSLIGQLIAAILKALFGRKDP